MFETSASERLACESFAIKRLVFERLAARGPVAAPLLYIIIALLLVCLGHFARFIEHADDRPT